ncbi:MAG TPA: hypothetical protein VJA28_02305 [Patescibacteria group bacterium]|nr:hypothetical protein [Patescibacteria group bacterium]
MRFLASFLLAAWLVVIATVVGDAVTWERAYGERWEWNWELDGDPSDIDFVVYFKYPHENQSKNFEVFIETENLAVRGLLNLYEAAGKQILVQNAGIDSVYQHVRVILGDTGINVLRGLQLTDEQIAKSLYFYYPLYSNSTPLPSGGGIQFASDAFGGQKISLQQESGRKVYFLGASSWCSSINGYAFGASFFGPLAGQLIGDRCYFDFSSSSDEFIFFNYQNRSAI